MKKSWWWWWWYGAESERRKRKIISSFERVRAAHLHNHEHTVRDVQTQLCLRASVYYIWCAPIIQTTTTTNSASKLSSMAKCKFTQKNRHSNDKPVSKWDCATIQRNFPKPAQILITVTSIGKKEITCCLQCESLRAFIRWFDRLVGRWVGDCFFSLDVFSKYGLHKMGHKTTKAQPSDEQDKKNPL